ncbi:hypothetical protein F8M41_003521 [Gigaspora margarita]|uniref:Uncharacterized protein n=1 Tax=Gigaspora margarita TaxID=4874 RepID=A0A8H3XB83_GIGMA|nr:hypothetical protein F8M41_003521 [Gigaspora margarita]
MIPNDVATIYCKISSPLGKIVQVPSVMIDSRANCSVISKGLIKLLGAEVDKNKKPSVKWHNNSLESSGISYNISVTVGQGENSCTISKDFLVMDDDKPWILLGTPWLDCAGWEPIVKREFKLMHKNKRLQQNLILFFILSVTSIQVFKVMGFGLDSMSSRDGICNEVVVKLSVEKTVNFSRSCRSSSHMEALSARFPLSHDKLLEGRK